MKLHVYVNRDRVSGIYSKPYFIVEDKEHVAFAWDQAAHLGEVTKFQSTFEIYELGIYDDIQCLFDLKDKPDFVLDGNVYYQKALLNAPKKEEKEDGSQG